MRRFIVLLVVAAAVSCGGDSSTSANTPVSGTYTLRSVNGLKLPFIVAENDSTRFEILSDAFTLADDRSWTEAGTSRTTLNGETSTDAIARSGTYVLGTGTKITLISSNGDFSDGTIGGGTLTVINEAVSAVYQK
jgi:hypothetical protein